MAPFKPAINPKSEELAEMHYSRVNAKQELEEELSTELEKTEPSESRESAEETRYKTVQRLFDMLSQDGQLITKESIKGVVEDLPLMCIKVMDKLI